MLQFKIREFDPNRLDINYCVYDWMILNLSLRGNEILVFAYLYFYKDDASITRVSTATGMSEAGCRKVINRLLTKDLVIKKETNKKWRYKIKMETVIKKAFSAQT